MIITNETAQLILDAIAWCNQRWCEDEGYEADATAQVVMARADFVNFCKARGIEEVRK